jgi:hypothetical protein
MRTVLVTMLLAAVGCSSTAERFCDRADSCKILTTTVDECVHVLEDALDQLPTSDRDEAEHLLEECLDHPSCSGFSSCIASLRTVEDGPAALQTTGLLATD